MANILKSAGGDLVRGIAIPNSPLPPAGNSSNVCERPREVGVRRRELLVASTSVRGPLTGLLLQPRDQVSSLADYHNLQNAQQLKFKYASPDIDVASLFRSSREVQPCDVGVPVEARVCRPAFSEEFGGREEEVIIEGIKVRREKAMWFDVYIREEEMKEFYCGSFIHLPPPKKSSRANKQKQRRREIRSCSLRLGIGAHVIGEEKERRSVIVRLVPRLKMEGHAISVQTIRIQYS